MNSRHDWQDDAACLNSDRENFFDNYEEDDEAPHDIRKSVDKMCLGCPVMRTCFAYAKYYELTGVWGGIYMNRGQMDEEFNDHKTPDDWATTYMRLIE